MNKRRVLSLLMAVILFLTSSNGGGIVLANEIYQLFNDLYSPPIFENAIDLEFSYVQENNEFGENDRPMSKDGVLLNITLNPKFVRGAAQGVRVYLDLPYLEYDEEGNSYQYTKRDTLVATGAAIEASAVSGSAIMVSSGSSIELDTFSSDEEKPALTMENGIGITTVHHDESWQLDYEPEYRGAFQIDRYSLEAGSMPSFTVELKFFGEVPQNVIADIKGWVEYDRFDREEKPWNTTDWYSENAHVRIVNTSLTWDTEVKTLQQYTTVWDRFNYVPFDFTITNYTDSMESPIERFSLHMAIPYKGEEYNELGYIGGMTDLDAILWESTPSGPKYNSALTRVDGTKYVGVPGKGGILIYDITNESSLKEDEMPTSEPLSYTYSGAALLTLDISPEDERLYSEYENKLDKSKQNQRKYRIYIPFDNRFIKGRLPHIFNMKVQSTVHISDKDRYMLWTKDADSAFSLYPPDLKPMTFEKVPQSNKAYYGVEGSYYFQNIYNPSNAPYFKPFILDTIPRDFDLKRVTYEVDWNGVDPPKLTDYMSDQGAIIEYDIKYIDRYNKSYTKAYSLTEADAVGKQVGEKYVFEFLIGDIVDFNKEQIVKSGYWNPVLQRDIKIHLKSRVESRETLKGTVGISGVFQVGGPVINEAYLYYNFTSHLPPENYYPGDIAYEANYHEKWQEPIYDDAMLDVIKPSPIINVKSYDGNNKYAGDNLTVQYNNFKDDSLYSGFQYYLGNRTGSPMNPGVLYISLPVNDPVLPTETESIGLMSEKIVISKELWSYALSAKDKDGTEIIDKIELIQKESDGTIKTHVVSGAAIYTMNVPNTKDLEIKRGSTLWPDWMDKPYEINVHFNIYPTEIADPIVSRYFVGVYGRTNQYGTLLTNATWKCVVEGASVLSHSGSNRLYVQKPNPGIIVKSYDGKNEVGDGVETTYDGYIGTSGGSGYLYYLGNPSISVMADSRLVIQLPSEDSLPLNNYKKGLLTDKLVLSANLWKMHRSVRASYEMDLINRIEFIYHDSFGNPKKYTIQGKALTDYVDNGNFSINDDIIIEKGGSLWPEHVDGPKEIHVYFNVFSNNISTDMTKDIYIGAFGRTTKYRELPTQGTFINDSSQTVGLQKSGTNYLDVQLPKPYIQVKGYDGKLNAEKDIQVRYDGYSAESVESGYRYYIGNESISAMGDGVFTALLPIYEAESAQDVRNGLMAEKIVISKELWELGAVKELKLHLKDNITVYTMTRDDILNKGTVEDGNYVIKKGSTLWPDTDPQHALFKLEANLNTIPAKVTDPSALNYYITIQGRTTRHGLLPSEGDVSCILPDQTKVQSKDTTNLDVMKPAPTLVVKAFDGTYKIGDGLEVNLDTTSSSNSGFHYYLENDSLSDIETGELTMNIPVFDSTANSGSNKSGLLVEQIVISGELWNIAKELKNTKQIDLIDRIELFEENPVGKQVISGDVLYNLIPKLDGSIVIKKDSPEWPLVAASVQNPKKIVVYLNYFPANITESETKKIYISPQGRTTRYGELLSEGEWASIIHYYPKIISETNNFLFIHKPQPNVFAYAKYGELNNQKVIADKTLTDEQLGWTMLPYGRKGEYTFELSNKSTSAVPEGTVTLDFTVSPVDSTDESSRGYRLDEFTLTKGLLEVMDVHEILIRDTEGKTAVIKQFSDGYFFADGTNMRIGNNLIIDEELYFTKSQIPDLANVKSVQLSYEKFQSEIARNIKYAIITKGYLDNKPFISSKDRWGDWVYPTTPSNKATGEWNVTINEAEKLNSKDITGFTTMAPFIDYNMYSKIGTTKYTNMTTLFNEAEDAYEIPNKYMDVGYKSIGSFVSGIHQMQRYDANVAMTLNLEMSVPHKDFNLYYIKLNPILYEHMDEKEAVRIYRNDASGKEYLWCTIGKNEWVGNAKDLNGNSSNWFRINTLLASNADITGEKDVNGEKQDIRENLFSTVAVDTNDENQVHPYYESPNKDIKLENQVTRVVFKLHINQEAVDENGKAKLPDLNTADNLFHLTGRFYKHSGETFADSTITYDFGDGPYARKSMPPNKTLTGEVKTVDFMLNTIAFAYSNLWGTSYTRSYFKIHQPVAAVRKGIYNSGNKLPEKVTSTEAEATTYEIGKEPNFGERTGFLIGFWNETDTTTVIPEDRINDWLGKKIFVDEAKITDSFPSVISVTGEDNPYEGFIIDKIKYAKADSSSYFRDNFKSIDIVTNKGRKFGLDDSYFTGQPIQVNVCYESVDTLPSGNPGYDILLKDGEFVTEYVLTVKDMGGDGDTSAEFSGVKAESVYYDALKAAIEVEGRICSINYQLSKAEASFHYTSNGTGVSPYKQNDYAKIKAVAPELSGSLKITNNVAGENQYVYKPRNPDEPNIMEYKYHLSNPAKTGTSPKAPIGKFELEIPHIPYYQLQEIIIPKDIFGGADWECESISIGSNQVKSEFILVNNQYKLDVTLLPERYVTDAAGHRAYNSQNATIKVVFHVKDPKDKTKYLKENQSLSVEPAVTLRGVYAKKPSSDIDWSNSVATVAQAPWTFTHSFTSNNIVAHLNSLSNTKYTNPPRVSTTSNSDEHEIKNLAAKIDFSMLLGNAYDVHNQRTEIAKENVMPGDRFTVRLDMKNTGSPNNYLDGFTDLKQPMLRYEVPKGVRIVQWDVVKKPSDVTAADFYCEDNSPTASSTAIQSGVEHNTLGSYIKDVTFKTDKELKQGQQISIEVVLEYTDEIRSSIYYPDGFQGNKIQNVSGTFTVGGVMTHGYFPFLYADRQNEEVVLPEGYTRGNFVLESNNSVQSYVSGARRVDGIQATMVDTTPLSLKVDAMKSYNGKKENIIGADTIITVGNIVNSTKHDHTNLQIELVLDNGASNLKGHELVEWPDIQYPFGFSENEYDVPLLYYKTENKTNPWVEVVSGAAIVADIYALKWDYGKIPAYDRNKYPFQLDDVQIHTRAYWRSAQIYDDNSAYYTIRSTASSIFTHEPHDYLSTGNQSIGKLTNYDYNVYKEIPFPELISQVFDSELDAKAMYKQLNAKRKTMFRPGDELWYKLILKNNSRDSLYTEVGTGPLLSPVIIDKVPEYLILEMTANGIDTATGGALDIASPIYKGDLEIVWYDKDNNRKTFENPTVMVKEIKDYDIGGSTLINDYQNINTIAGSNVFTAKNSEYIKYYLIEYRFKEDLGRDERIEIQYKAKVRMDNLPQMYFMKYGMRYGAYLPRDNEYSDSIYGNYPNVNATEHVTGKAYKDNIMDGDFLLHEVGVTGVPNLGTPKWAFLNHSISWMPGYDGSSTHNYITNQVSGHNGDLFDYDLKSSFVQRTEMELGTSYVKYINSKYQTMNATNASRDMWELIVRPRTTYVKGIMGYTGNILWASDRLHLAKSWLYGSSEMIPKDTNNRYELDGTTYTYEDYQYAVERGEVFTSRLQAINYGDYYLDGFYYTYVLPRGTEPVFDGDKLKVNIYYGEPSGTKQTINNYSVEVLQKPGDVKENYFYAPKGVMEYLDGGKGAFYAHTEKDSKPWVLRIHVKDPLSSLWNNKIAAGGALSYSVIADLSVRVIEENINGFWYDELFVSAADNETGYYTQIYSHDYSIPANRTPMLRYHRTHTGRLNYSQMASPAKELDSYTVDTDFDNVPNEKLYAHSGDLLAMRKPMIRVWSDIDNTDTAAFYHEVQESAFNLNIHVYNRYEWVHNPKTKENILAQRWPWNQIWTVTDERNLEKYWHNHQTDGGLKGTYFEPVISNILPYGVVPVDIFGKALPADGVGWVDDGSRPVDFEISGIPYSKDKWKVVTEFLNVDAANAPLNRYKVTFIPLDTGSFSDEVKILYNEHLVIKLKSKTVIWPEKTYLDIKEGILVNKDMSSRWQENRTYATTKKDTFFFKTEPESSPYKVGSSRRLDVSSDTRPDIQGAYDKIKANVLGKLTVGYEQDRIDVEDYSTRIPAVLTADQKDFNKNNQSATSAEDDRNVWKDRFVTNTMKIYTKGPRIVIDKTVSNNKEIGKDKTVTTSYGNNVWFNLTFKNVPIPVTDYGSLSSLQAHEATKGSILCSDILVSEWMSEYLDFEDYMIQYPHPVISGRQVYLDADTAKANGWVIDYKPLGSNPIYPKFLSLSVRTGADFMGLSNGSRNNGDLRTGESFTLKLRTRVTKVGQLDDKLEIPWGKFESTTYFNTKSYLSDKQLQPPELVRLAPYINEKTANADYNLNGVRTDEFGTDRADFYIEKPKGYIRMDSVRTRSEFTSEGLDYPMFNSGRVSFMVDELQSYQADIPELIIAVSGFSDQMHKKRIDAPLKWEAPLESITTGRWEVPEGYDPYDYRIDVYYTLEDDEFEDLGDRSKWVLLDKDIPLDENREIRPTQYNSKINKVFYVISSKEPDKNPVPAKIRIDVDADENTEGKQDVSEVDPSHRNVDGFTASVYDNTPQVSYMAVTKGEESYVAYSSVSYWGRYSKSDTVMLGSDYAGVILTPNTPVLDITNDVQYFRNNVGSKKLEWSNLISVDTDNSRYLKYTIDFTNVEKDRADLVFYPEDKLVNPVIVDALPSIVTVDPDHFRLAQTEEEKKRFNEDYSSKLDFDEDMAQWTWEIVEGAGRGEDTPPSDLRFSGFEVTHITNASIRQPNIPFTRKVVRWKFDGTLQPGDTLQIKFLAVVNAHEIDDNKSTINDVYGFNANGTLILFNDPDKRREKKVAALDTDDYDLNDDKKVDDRFVKNESKGIGFATKEDVKKVNRSFTDLEQDGSSPYYASAATEGSVYTIRSSVVNPTDVMKSYEYPIIYSLLPYKGDENVLSIYENNNVHYGISRNSIWSGWLIPESIRIEEASTDGTITFDPSEYNIWVGPYKKEGNTIKLLTVDALPDLGTRSPLKFYQSMSGKGGTVNKENYIRSNNFVKLSELMSVKASDPELYDKLRKGALAIYAEMSDANYRIYGQKSFVLAYDMEAPQNIPVLNEKPDGLNHEQYTGWNSFSAWIGTAKMAGESNAAGVYLNLPEKKITIGNHIWIDENGNGIQDEVETEIGDNGRVLTKITDSSKDPGVNGVKVELLSKDGKPVDQYGNTLVQKAGSSAYYIAGENGLPKVDIFGRELKGGQPVVHMTASDYEDRKGYYILSSFEPGEYRLRYTFPEEYKHYGLTTLSTHEDLSLTGSISEDDTETLVAVTEPFIISDGLEDSYYMDFDIGIQLPVRYGGTAWVDEHISEQEKGKNGKMDFPWEMRLKDSVIQLYTEDGKPVVDMLGNRAETVTDENGEFIFEFLRPNETYYVTAKYNKQIDGYPTPIYSAYPLDAEDNNDIYRTVDGINRTRAFTAAIPKKNGVPSYAGGASKQYEAVNRLGIGFVNLTENMVSGILYEDVNKNGLLDNEETRYSDMEVYLERYMLVDGIWEKDPGFIDKKTSTSDEGSYYFDQLESLSVSGLPYGYHVYVSEFPNGMTPTYYQSVSEQISEQFISEVDSDLCEDGTLFNGDLNDDWTGKKLIVFAEQSDNGNWSSRTTIASGINGGFTKLDKGTIGGNVMQELGGSSIHDSVAGLDVKLMARAAGTSEYKPVLVTSDRGEIVVVGMEGYNELGTEYKFVTDQYGNYKFDKLPLADDLTRTVYEYQIVTEKPDFAEWENGNYQVVSGGSIAVYGEIVLAETLEEGKFNYNLLESKDSLSNDLNLIYPEPSFINGYYYNDRSKNGQYDSGEGLMNRKVMLYVYDSESGSWKAHTDLKGRNLVYTDEKGYYSFMVNSGIYDLQKDNLMEQLQYRLVFEKTAKESFLSECDVTITSESNLSDSEKAQLSLDWLKNGVTSNISFGSLSYSDPLYGGRDVLDIREKIEQVKHAICAVEEASDGIVKGIVWMDENENGMKDSGEEPAAGRTVSLYRLEGDEWKNVADLNGNSFVKTDEKGAYEFRVEAAEYNEDSKLLEVYQYQVVFEKDVREYYSDMILDETDNKVSPMADMPPYAGLDSGLKSRCVYGVSNEDLVFADEIFSVELDKNVVDRDSIRDIDGLDCGIVPHRTGRISGILWKDSNRNGLRDSYENTVSDKQVAIYRYSKENKLWEPYTDYNNGSFESVSNIYGKYEFEVDVLNYDMESPYFMEPNQYRIVFEKEENVEYFSKPFMMDDRVNGSSAKTEEQLVEAVPGIVLGSNKAVTDTIVVVSGSAIDANSDIDSNSRIDASGENDANGAINISSATVVNTESSTRVATGSAFYVDRKDFMDQVNINCGFMEQPLSSISGVVWHDLNQDGIRQSNEKELADEELFLYRYDRADGKWKLHFDMNNSYRIKTGIDGAYEFIVDISRYEEDAPYYLEPEIYRVFAVTTYGSGFTAPWVGDDYTLDSDGFRIEELTAEELEGLGEIEMTELSAVSAELSFKTKFDQVLSREIIDVESAEDLNAVDFGVLKNDDISGEEGSVPDSSDTEVLVVAEIKISDEDTEIEDSKNEDKKKDDFYLPYSSFGLPERMIPDRNIADVGVLPHYEQEISDVVFDEEDELDEVTEPLGNSNEINTDTVPFVNMVKRDQVRRESAPKNTTGIENGLGVIGAGKAAVDSDSRMDESVAAADVRKDVIAFAMITLAGIISVGGTASGFFAFRKRNWWFKGKRHK